jgi:GDPmannose 4,6-dehydratase
VGTGVTTALIIGAAGQDGILLSRLLLENGLRVIGLVRPGAAEDKLRRLAPSVEITLGDVTDSERLGEVLDQYLPEQVYNLAALSSVGRSWELVEDVMAVNAISVVHLLEGVRRLQARADGRVRYYQASSSEMFGLPTTSPQDENTNFHPRSPYAVAKLAAHYLTINYRESYGLFACSGILYNHESPLREPHFVTRKITQAAAAISLGLTDQLTLGTLDVARDWGHAEDYVDAMWRITQHDQPGDYIVATGLSRTLREFLGTAFGAVGIQDWEPYVRCDPALRRPIEVSNLVGNPGKAHRVLGWTPRHTFEDMVAEMVDADLRLLHDAEHGGGPNGKTATARRYTALP